MTMIAHLARSSMPGRGHLSLPKKALSIKCLPDRAVLGFGAVRSYVGFLGLSRIIALDACSEHEDVKTSP